MKMRLEQFSLDSGECCLVEWPEQFTESDRVDMLDWMDLIKRKIENAEIKPSDAQRDPPTPPKGEYNDPFFDVPSPRAQGGNFVTVVVPTPPKEN